MRSEGGFRCRARLADLDGGKYAGRLLDGHGETTVSESLTSIDAGKARVLWSSGRNGTAEFAYKGRAIIDH